jgi:parallel beta-helix repeat protein
MSVGSGYVAVNIVTSGVTLDCNDSTLIGSNTSGSYGIYIQPGVNNVIVKNCVVEKQGYGITDIENSGNTITNNTVQHNVNRGVFIKTSNNNLIENNRVNQNTEHGVSLDYKSNSNNVTNNIITDNRKDGINVYKSKHNTLSYNIITGHRASYEQGNYIAPSGIYLVSRTNNTTISNNYLDNNHWGIYSILSSGQGRISNNNISNSTGPAIVMNDWCVYNTLTNNLLLSNSKGSVNETNGGNRANALVYENEYGTVMWNDSSNSISVLSDIGLGVGIILSENSTYVNATSFPELDSQAEVTIKNTDQYNFHMRAIYKDNSPCTKAESCTIIEDANNFKFFVPGFSTYSVGEEQLPPVENLSDSETNSSWAIFNWNNSTTGSIDHLEIWLNNDFHLNMSGITYNATGLLDDYDYTIIIKSANSTGYSSYNSTSIVRTLSAPGNHSTIGNLSSNVENITMNITDSNGSQIGDGQNVSGVHNITFTSNNTSVLSFEFNFTEQNLHLDGVSIEKQEENSSTGSVIVKNLNMSSGQTKSVRLDQIGGWDYVCIKDAEVANISEVDNVSCNRQDETKVECDGVQHGAYTCTDHTDYYIVSGLTNSAVVEMNPPEEEEYRGGGGGGGGSTRPILPLEPEPEPEEPKPEEPETPELPIIPELSKDTDEQLDLPTGPTGFVGLISGNVRTLSAVLILFIIACIVAYAKREKLKKYTSGKKPSHNNFNKSPPSNPDPPAETQPITEISGLQKETVRLITDMNSGN